MESGEKVAKSGEKWLKVGIVEKSGEMGLKLVKSGEKWGKVMENGKK